jgi:GntR family transcriptional regulator/MocR family aminotransferase
LMDWAIKTTNESALLLNFTNIDTQATAERLGRRILNLM